MGGYASGRISVLCSAFFIGRVLQLQSVRLARQGDVRRALTAGFTHHLTKVIEPETLEDLVASREIQDW
jgi:hypothetical protein